MQLFSLAYCSAIGGSDMNCQWHCKIILIAKAQTKQLFLTMVTVYIHCIPLSVLVPDLYYCAVNSMYIAVYNIFILLPVL